LKLVYYQRKMRASMLLLLSVLQITVQDGSDDIVPEGFSDAALDHSSWMGTANSVQSSPAAEAEALWRQGAQSHSIHRQASSDARGPPSEPGGSGRETAPQEKTWKSLWKVDANIRAITRRKSRMLRKMAMLRKTQRKVRRMQRRLVELTPRKRQGFVVQGRLLETGSLVPHDAPLSNNARPPGSPSGGAGKPPRVTARLEHLPYRSATTTTTRRLVKAKEKVRNLQSRIRAMHEIMHQDSEEVKSVKHGLNGILHAGSDQAKQTGTDVHSLWRMQQAVAREKARRTEPTKSRKKQGAAGAKEEEEEDQKPTKKTGAEKEARHIWKETVDKIRRKSVTPEGKRKKVATKSEREKLAHMKRKVAAAKTTEAAAKKRAAETEEKATAAKTRRKEARKKVVAAEKKAVANKKKTKKTAAAMRTKETPKEEITRQAAAEKKEAAKKQEAIQNEAMKKEKTMHTVIAVTSMTASQHMREALKHLERVNQLAKERVVAEKAAEKAFAHAKGAKKAALRKRVLRTAAEAARA